MTPLLTDAKAPLRQAPFRLILFEGARCPALLASYRRVVMDPLLATVRALSVRARERGGLMSDALEPLPMPLLAPGLVVTVRNHLLPATTNRETG